MPSFEQVAFARPDHLNARDGNLHIHQKRVRGVIPDRVVAAERVVFDVAVPHDESLPSFGGFYVCAQAEDIDGTVRGYLLAPAGGEIQNERTAGVCKCAVHIFAILGTPSLDDPIGENAVGRRGGRTRHRHHLGFVKVQVVVHRNSARHTTTTFAHILHHCALRTVELVFPLCIEIQLLGNPETIAAIKTDKVAVIWLSIRTVRVSLVVDGILEIPPLVNQVCRIGRILLDVVGSVDFETLLVQGVGLGEESRGAFRLRVPSTEGVKVALPEHRRADFITIADAEAHGLVIATPVEARVAARLRVQEYTVLHLSPFGIHAHTAERHRGERVRLGTGLVGIPPFKNKTVFSMGKVRGVCSTRGNIRTVRNIQCVV